jgi:FKBP-type peptidyl-prolyl cis-trans isomerase
LVIPSRLAYGTGGRGAIPPNANLVFVVDAVAKY